jgi:Protein of unknown function (DUF3455)
MQSNFKLVWAGLVVAIFSSFSSYSSAGEYESQKGVMALSTTAVVPTQLQLPKEQTLLLETAAKGVQVYTCQPKENDPQQFGWKLKAPEATLYTKLTPKGDKLQAIGKHYAGPTWEYKDGSKIQGKVQAKADSPDANAIPWLLLDVTAHEGKGILSQVSNVQRLNTVGGQAPPKGCDATKKDAEVKVDYTADYYFYGKDASKQ